MASSEPPTATKLTCLICFGMETGVKWEDYFVKTGAGHLFHYCCVRFMLTDNGISSCPACDEDLRVQNLVRVTEESLAEQHLQDFLGYIPSKSVQLGTSVSATLPLHKATPPVGMCSPYATLNLRTTPIANENPAVIKGKSKNWKGPKKAGTLLKKQVNRLADATTDVFNGSTKPKDKKTVALPQASRSSNCLQKNTPDFVFKVAVIGDYDVGKSSLLRRFTDESFDHHITPTVGCDLRIKTMEVANKLVRLSLWDTAGQERFREALIGGYLRKTDGIIYCFDVTNLESLASLHVWNEFTLLHAPEHAIKIMVGNKLDLWDANKRVVEPAYIANVANHLNIPNIYCSAKDSVNVEAVFRTLVSQMLEYRIDLMETSVTLPHEAEKIFRIGNDSHVQKKKCCG